MQKLRHTNQKTGKNTGKNHQNEQKNERSTESKEPAHIPTETPKEKTANPEEKILGNTLPMTRQRARKGGTPCAKRREFPLTKRN